MAPNVAGSQVPIARLHSRARVQIKRASMKAPCTKACPGCVNPRMQSLPSPRHHKDALRSLLSIHMAHGHQQAETPTFKPTAVSF